MIQPKIWLNSKENMEWYWYEPKVRTQKENTEHGLEVWKIYEQKLQRIVSNIGSRTAVLLLPYEGITIIRGARGVMVIVVGNGHGDTSSNPGPG